MSCGFLGDVVGLLAVLLALTHGGPLLGGSTCVLFIAQGFACLLGQVALAGRLLTLRGVLATLGAPLLFAPLLQSFCF